MTGQQKLILASLAVLAACVLISLGGAIVYLLTQEPITPVQPAVAAVQPAVATAAQPPPATPTVTPPTPPALATSTPTVLPSPTNTRVVADPGTRTPTPPPVNCLDKISNFEASGIITNDEVEAFLRRTLPAHHMDRCQAIKYIHKTISVHDTTAAGRFIPIFRQISVYAVDPQYQGVEDVLDTLVHEVGHNVHFNLRLDNWEVSQQWTELHKQSRDTFAQTGRGFVSDYAQTNEFEDFAESYMAYVRTPQVLKAYSPEKYDYIRQVIFTGQEYAY